MIQGDTTTGLRWIDWSDLEDYQASVFGPSLVAAYWAHAASQGFGNEVRRALAELVRLAPDMELVAMDESRRAALADTLTRQALEGRPDEPREVTASQQVRAGTGPRIAEKLEELDDLLRQGYITRSEFQDFRRRLLSQHFQI